MKRKNFYFHILLSNFEDTSKRERELSLCPYKQMVEAEVGGTLKLQQQPGSKMTQNRAFKNKGVKKIQMIEYQSLQQAQQPQREIFKKTMRFAALELRKKTNKIHQEPNFLFSNVCLRFQFLVLYFRFWGKKPRTRKKKWNTQRDYSSLISNRNSH